jgi:hypothetical protein
MKNIKKLVQIWRILYGDTKVFELTEKQVAIMKLIMRFEHGPMRLKQQLELGRLILSDVKDELATVETLETDVTDLR